ncbi:MAG: hypothetical protein DWQ42_08210 [Planctomycetota bacterium]
MDSSFNTSRSGDPPRRLPAACPSCDRAFSKVLKPHRRLQTKAKLIIAIGLLASLLLIPVAGLGIWIGLSQLADAAGVHFIPFPEYVLGFSVLIVSAIPAYFMSVWALRFPKIVSLRCKRCGWVSTYVVDSAGRVVEHELEHSTSSLPDHHPAKFSSRRGP